MGKLEIITKRNRIKSILKRWKKQYPAHKRTKDKEEIYCKLKLLDLETATEDDIADAIGNSSWTDLRCDFCGQDYGKIAIIYDEECHSFCLCIFCVRRILNEMKEIGD